MSNGAYGHDTFAHDGCLQLFETAMGRLSLTFPARAKVLEIGCAEADWQTPMLKLRPDLNIVGIDWRTSVRPGICLKGDVLTVNFNEGTFDAVVGVSSIEHIGLGHYESDPIDEDGDMHAMQRVVQWLKPGGWVYADVPYDQTGYRVEGTSHRVYDEAALERRLFVPGLAFIENFYHLPDDGSLQYVMFRAVKA